MGPTTRLDRTQPDSEPEIDSLRARQRALREQGRLHWFHWTILGLSLAITLFAWHTSSTLFEERERRRFELEADRVVGMMRERLTHYEDALLSGVAAVQARGGSMTRGQWRLYADFLDLPTRYPGISGIGMIRYVPGDELEAFLTEQRAEKADFTIHPDHAFDFHLPITYVEPEASNAAAVGLDVAFETNRREGALRARALGTTQISGPIVLVQDAGKTPGFLFYAPYYESAVDPNAYHGNEAAYREAAFSGLVYAPLVVADLVAGTLGRENRNVIFAIRDGADVLFDELDGTQATSEAQSAVRELDLYGRTWRFELHGIDAGAVSGGVDQPLVVLVGGLTIDAMLLALFALMARSNRRVLDLAEEMINDLASQAASLAESCRDLESFAHVVSHDLKTPIRGIRDLTGFLEEDLEDYLASERANPDVRRSIKRLYEQADKSDALIGGILDYSLAGTEDEQRSIVDSRVLVGEIGETLDVRRDQLVLEGDFPVFETDAVRLGQVLANLIGNAFKYHHDRESARVSVSVERRGAFHRFSVADDGPGIDPRFHARVFEAFTTLESVRDVQSSGIGLSIVKRSVERLGGTVEIESSSGHGATFHFSWPVSDPAGFKEAA